MRYLMTEREMTDIQFKKMTQLYVELLGVDEDIAFTMSVNAHNINRAGEIAAQEAFYDSKYN
jgi:hypothetical protein